MTPRKHPPELPRVNADSFGVTLKATALARTVQDVSKAHYHVLNERTTFVRIHAVDKDIYLKWANSDVDYCNEDNFDDMVIADTYLDFGLPVKSDGTIYDSIQFVNREDGGTVIIVEK